MEGTVPFIKTISQYRYAIIYPPLNTLDSFSTWETLLVKTIPIVQNIGALNDLYRQLPVFVVNNLNEISQIKQETLDNFWINLQWKNYNWGILLKNYWVKEVKEAQNDCGFIPEDSDE
jgi:hypothetical protein